MKTQEEQQLHAQGEQVRGKLRELAADLRVVDDEIESLAPQRTEHELLEQASGSLEKLGQLGVASLFWGERVEPAQVAERLREVRSRVDAFQARLGALDERRRAILAETVRQEENLEILGYDLYDVLEQEERRKLEWVVEREIGPVPSRVQVLAWARGGEDDSRFRKSLTGSLLASLLLGGLIPMIDLPLPARFQPEEVPKRIAQLVRQEQARPLPPPPAVAQRPTEQVPPEQQKPMPGEKPKPSEPRQLPPQTPDYAAADLPPGTAGPGDDPSLPPGPPDYSTAAAEPQQPPMRPGKPGILAFRDEFASLARDKVAPRIGAGTRFIDADDAARVSTRSMLTTNAPGSSGGINLASLSRSVGGTGAGGPGALHGSGGGGGAGGGGGGSGLPVTSPIAAIAGDDRPLAHGPGPARTDEEIQIVFDRYKASFYRLYNRELRNDPTLQGQMVLRLTIEPDGSVSMCVLQSSDMDAPDLSAQVVTRVRTMNFGAKDGVQALTIVYPIDFLPAA